MEKREHTIVLTSPDDSLITEIANHKEIRPHLGERWDRRTVAVLDAHRGLVKQALVKVGFPVEDLAGYITGDPFEQRLREVTLSGEPFVLRHYQEDAINAFHAGGSARGGSGVIVLPCGAGKTVIGMGVMEK